MTFHYLEILNLILGLKKYISRCSPFETIGNAEENVLIEEINIPLRYDDIDFKFWNLGSFANTVVNGIGIYFLQTQEELLVGELKKAIKKNMNSLIC